MSGTERGQGELLVAAAEWVDRLEAWDHTIIGHSSGVAQHGERLGRSIGLTADELAELRLGCLLHDVDKLGVPMAVLTKRGELAEREWAQVRRHPAEGQRLAKRMGVPAAVARVIRCHHERWDGSGYPDGLVGEAIPLHARVMAVADVYDALTSPRAYRPALTVREALATMEREAGSVLEPVLVERFAGLVARSPLAVIEGVERPAVRPARPRASN